MPLLLFMLGILFICYLFHKAVMEYRKFKKRHHVKLIAFCKEVHCIKQKFRKAQDSVVSRALYQDGDAHHYIFDQLKNLNISVAFNNEICDMIIESKDIGIIFQVENSEVIIYNTDFIPFYKELYKVMDETNNLATTTLAKNNQDRNNDIKAFMKDFDGTALRVTNKLKS